MKVANASCCEPFVLQHGFPPHFVQSVVPKPAVFLRQYEEQLTELEIKLQEAEVCIHYANQARIYLRQRCDDELVCYIKLADFLGWPPSEAERVLDEGQLEDLLSHPQGPLP